MDIFEPTKTIELAEGVMMTIRAPNAREMGEARGLAREMNGLAGLSDEEADALLNDRLPSFMARLVVDVVGAGSAWRERLVDWPYLRGIEGTEVFQEICFRPYRKAPLSGNG